MLFGKSEYVYNKVGDREEFRRCRAALKEAGIRPVQAGENANQMPVGGCGSKLDIRDFGPNGKIDRSTYFILVRPEDAARARELLRELGVEPAR